MKRRKFAPAAIFLAGLLLAAVTAASVGAANKSPAQASAAAAVGPGKTVAPKGKAKLSKAGVTGGVSAGAAGPTGPPVSKGAKPSARQVTANTKVNRPMPPKKYFQSSAKTSSFRAAPAQISFPTASSLPITTHFKGTAVPGLNALDQASVGGYELTPPDDALCEGNGYVLQAVNNVLQVRSSSDLHVVLGAEAMESFFSPALTTTGFDFLSDPACYFDPDTQHWFVTELALDSVNLSGSAVFIATSVTTSPVGPWNIYVLDTTFDGVVCTAAINQPSCLGDQPKIGANKNAFFISTNSFDNGTGVFNGAQLYVLDKSGLALGLSSVNTAYFDIGQFFDTPEGFDDCGGGVLPDASGFAGFPFCWYSVVPATTPNAMYTTARGGTEFLLSALDWFLSIDNRIALWAVTGTSTINQVFPSLTLQYAVVTTESYGFPPNAVQKAGPIPFGDTLLGPPSPGVGPIATNDDRMADVKFTKTKTDSSVWGALNTIVQVPGCCNVLNTHAGIAYFDFRPIWIGPFLVGATVVNQGYIANAFEDVAFPGLALGAQNLGTSITYTLTGNEYFPTAAVSKATPTAKAANIQIALLGQSPNDDFCEYGLCPGPRWGDYSAGVADGSLRYLSTLYIQAPNCSDVEYVFDPTCGGVRAPDTNWGTAIMKTNG